MNPPSESIRVFTIGFDLAENTLTRTKPQAPSENRGAALQERAVARWSGPRKLASGTIRLRPHPTSGNDQRLTYHAQLVGFLEPGRLNMVCAEFSCPNPCTSNAEPQEMGSPVPRSLGRASPARDEDHQRPRRQRDRFRPAGHWSGDHQHASGKAAVHERSSRRPARRVSSPRALTVRGHSPPAARARRGSGGYSGE
jgi:hypothetical protein